MLCTTLTEHGFYLARIYTANSETNINVNRLQRVRKIATSKLGELALQAKMMKSMSLGEVLIRTY